jgi:hypothetical protein
VSRLRLLLVAVVALALVALPGVASGQRHKHKAGHSKRHKTHRVRHGSTANSPSTATTSSDGSVDVRNSSVVSFDTASGKLTITLPGNQTLAGNVTSATELSCEAAEPQDQDEQGEQGRESKRMARHGADGRAGSSGTAPQESQDEANDNDSDDAQAQPSAQCSSADLKPGAKIAEAELNGNGDYTKVEIVK